MAASAGVPGGAVDDVAAAPELEAIAREVVRARAQHEHAVGLGVDAVRVDRRHVDIDEREVPAALERDRVGAGVARAARAAAAHRDVLEPHVVARSLAAVEVDERRIEELHLVEQQALDDGLRAAAADDDRADAIGAPVHDRAQDLDVALGRVLAPEVDAAGREARELEAPQARSRGKSWLRSRSAEPRRE